MIPLRTKRPNYLLLPPTQCSVGRPCRRPRPNLPRCTSRWTGSHLPILRSAMVGTRADHQGGSRTKTTRHRCIKRIGTGSAWAGRGCSRSDTSRRRRVWRVFWRDGDSAQRQPMREHRVPLLGYRRGRAEGWCWMSGCFNPSRSASPACDFSAPSSP
jgi:hypothetical protein